MLCRIGLVLDVELIKHALKIVRQRRGTLNPLSVKPLEAEAIGVQKLALQSQRVR